MIAHELDSTTAAASVEWTSQQKYQRMRRKDLIEVRLIAQAGVPERWHEARIVETNKGGAFAKLEHGTLQRFFHWNDCRMLARPEKSKPLATLGEIATGPIPSLQAPPPPQKPLPVFAPTSAPAAPVSAAAPAVQAPLVLFRRDPMPSDNKNSRNPHPQTDGNGRVLTSAGLARALPSRMSRDPRAIGSRVGDAITAERKRRGITQLGLADLSSAKNKPRNGGKVYNSQVSKIELGKVLPSDDELIALAEALDLGLESLIEMRDMDRSEREANATAEREQREIEREREYKAAREAREAARRAAIAPPTALRVEPPPRTEAERQSAVYQSTRQQRPSHIQTTLREPEPEPERYAVQVQATPAAGALRDLASFVESVEALVSMPIDKEARRRWFACVSELFTLSGGQS